MVVRLQFVVGLLKAPIPGRPGAETSRRTFGPPATGSGWRVAVFVQALANRPSWLRRVFPGALEDRDRFADRIDSVLADVGYVNPNEGRDEDNEKPKLHLKANFFASRTGWQELMTRPELARLLLLHAEYMAEQALLDETASLDDLLHIDFGRQTFLPLGASDLHGAIAWAKTAARTPPSPGQPTQAARD